MSKAKIGVLGTGDVGRVLGAGLAAAGHEVKMGSREPNSDKVRAWIEKTGAKASSGTFAEAAQFAEIAILATNWGGTENAIRLVGPGNLAGKVVIDATNPLAFKPNGPPELALGHTDSAGEQVQRWLPAGRVVKAFNMVGNAHMVKPSFPGGPPDMFICGNDPEAKRAVAGICDELGWPTIDLGDITGARFLEPLAMVWISYGIRTGSWNHAVTLLRKEMSRMAASDQEVLEIRPLAGPEEAEWCARLIIASEPWITLQRSYDQAFATVCDPTREVYVAAYGGDLRGFLILCMQGAFIGYVQTICIAPAWRNQGLGSRLLQFAESRILRESPNIFMCVSSFNTGARRLYERLGYRVVGELEGYIVPEHSEILLRKSVGPKRGYRKRS